MKGETLRRPSGGAESGQKGGSAGISSEDYILLPFFLLEQMGSLSDEAFRLVIRLHYHVWVSRDALVLVPVAELAEGAGLSLARAQKALAVLADQGWVRRVRGRWGLTEHPAERNGDHLPPLLPR